MVQGDKIGQKTNAVINPDFCSGGKKNPIWVQCGLVQGLVGTRNRKIVKVEHASPLGKIMGKNCIFHQIVPFLSQNGKILGKIQNFLMICSSVSSVENNVNGYECRIIHQLWSKQVP